MAFKTEPHAEGLIVVNDVHLVDLTVTLDAADAAVNVARVIKISVVGGFMNPNPRYRFTASVAIANGREQRARGLDDTMAIHARLGGRHIGMSGLVDVTVAIAAIHPQLGDVFSVAKRHGLDGRVADPGVLRGHVVGDACGRDPREHHQINDDLQRELISRFRENIRHGPRVSESVLRIRGNQRRA